jgi:hypothetical protein
MVSTIGAKNSISQNKRKNLVHKIKCYEQWAHRITLSESTHGIKKQCTKQSVSKSTHSINNEFRITFPQINSWYKQLVH